MVTIFVVIITIAVVIYLINDRNQGNQDLTRVSQSEALDKQIEADNIALEALKKSIERKYIDSSDTPIQFKQQGYPYKFEIEEYTALHFETANQDLDSIIKLSIAHFRGNQILDIREYYFSPINANNTNGDRFQFTHLHGIKPSDVLDKPTIMELWEEIEPQLQKKHLIVHNVDFFAPLLKRVVSLANKPLKGCTITCTSYYSKLFITWMYTLKLDLICNEHRIPYWGKPSKFKAVSTGLLFMYLSTIATNQSYNLFMTGKKISLKPIKKTIQD
ncbi:hypothetical protein FAZ19_19850 [Sphingobacterium alkalisoli]|uniref:Exonuclease domain-containing protein n=1 Tax=Sphingobacterium alkalisoli TaxID=1874115 RepID=A0A4U0GVV3_9SPHI|nr:exonuclease domain-containing protein [Sphingobacterium alkalisoli]TJY62724.1 hypothetical protein FAZ19_19850 [Sphingobacterium alkalisoli]GGH28473.1 hypothetical protein GCM10011418_39160 [Sphingobacterium alkalisoli]